MKLIVGLGNIGDKYLFTRHNIGFMVLDTWALQDGFSFSNESKFKASVARHNDMIFVKPTTFMNLSGESVITLMNYFKIDIKDVLIVYDDIALDLGKLRFRPSGSDGGHNGIKSIINHLHTNKFDRLKLGIGPQPPIPSENFVLQNFSKTQESELKEVLKKSVEAIQFHLDKGIVDAQNKYN